MSKKRPSAESSNIDLQPNGDSDLAVFQPDDNALRTKRASLSYTTLQDLPIEMLQCILVKVVTMEVKDMRLAKSVWKEKSGPVISKLRSVCSQWNSSLATNFFQNKVHRALDRMTQETFRVEILHQSEIELHPMRVTTLGDEMFIASDDKCLIVYDRNNMAKVKYVIPLPKMRLVDIAACIVSNCVYVLGFLQDTDCLSVLRVTWDDGHQFSIVPLIRDLRLVSSFLCVSASGKLMLASLQKGDDPCAVKIYNADGSLQHRIVLSWDIFLFTWRGYVLLKSNGNLVLVSSHGERKAQLTEIDMSGSIIRQYQSTLDNESAVSFADAEGRIVISEWSNKQELLDSELNLLMITDAQMNNESQPGHHHILHYNSEKNEIVGVYGKYHNDHSLVIFRFNEESDSLNKG